MVIHKKYFKSVVRDKKYSKVLLQKELSNLISSKRAIHTFNERTEAPAGNKWRRGCERSRDLASVDPP